MTDLEAVAREIDAYFGAAADVRPAVGMVATPLRFAARLREVLQALKGG